MRYMVRGIGMLVVAGSLWLAACATVAYTERRSLSLISESQEMQLGEQAFAEVLAANRQTADIGMAVTVKKVGQKLAAVAERADYTWEFVVLDASATVNAFALPGGKVAFYSGILPLCKDETGVAVVMGHEIAHVIARHGVERMSQGLIIDLVGSLLSASTSPESQQKFLQIYGITTALGVALPYSRAHEYEADRIGLILMAKAGYNPRAAADFWRRMMESSQGQKPPEFLSTHPSDEKRIAEIEKNLPEALSYYKP